ncbi:MAG: DNA protecting protein DprA [Desulfuromonadales bacterium GWD2_61_12]|nr:MAG: DNA protecting protein DprA [Desulfuromonadales bacterium GWC2_61_20]OGR36207.1 MAG: DNA protecting protein DprA [Desulfuromonadales bacterium GWD2_61_12]HBT84079.1 DNA-protecting protein DprA [Desulfuromonas sp.]
MSEHEENWLRLHLTRGLGRVGLFRLMETFATPAAALAAIPAWTTRARIRPTVVAAIPPLDDPQLRAARRTMDGLGVRLLSYWDDGYPELLRAIHDPPALLYLRGTLPAGEALAVVGSRHATPAGRRLTQEICRELAGRRLTIVSGLARGIDAAAHEGAVAGGGSTIGILGCGIDRTYPPENERLFQQVIAHGAILSEYPPGTPPLAGHFPGRNRIISGLCRGVLVVEAAEESGSLITVDFALEQGREVFAVPASVYAPTSRGVNRLLKEGARVVTEARDILAVLWPELPEGVIQRREDRFAASLCGDTQRLYLCLGEEPLHIDELAQKTALTPMEVSAILLTLELQGGVELLPGMRYLRNRKP